MKNRKCLVPIFFYVFGIASIFPQSSNISDQIKILQEYKFQIEAQLWQEDTFAQQSLQQSRQPTNTNAITELQSRLGSINTQLIELQKQLYSDLFGSCVILISYRSTNSYQMAENILDHILFYSNSRNVLLNHNSRGQENGFVISYSSVSLYETASKLRIFLQSLNSHYVFSLAYGDNRSNMITVMLP